MLLAQMVSLLMTHNNPTAMGIYYGSVLVMLLRGGFGLYGGMSLRAHVGC
jgi:hypothetical protein